jgi:hypothetical protein
VKEEALAHWGVVAPNKKKKLYENSGISNFKIKCVMLIPSVS